MSNLVKYGSYDVEAATEERAELDKSGGADFMKLSVGSNIVRFLPPPIGRRSPFVMVHQHFVQLPGMSNPASFACPRLMAQKACPVCQKIDQLRSTGNPADYDLAGDFLARLRVFSCVIDRKQEEMGARILAFGKTIHEQLVALRQDEDAGGDYTNPEGGFDINIERKGTSKNDTEYFVRPSRRSTPLASTPEQMQDWIDTQPDLAKFSRVLPWEDIVKMIGGGGTTRGTPQPRAAAPAAAPARAPAARGKSAEADAFSEPADDFPAEWGSAPKK